MEEETQYRVVKTLVTVSLPNKQIAINIASMYRSQGFGSEVITEEEYIRRSGEQQQDLTKL